MAILFISDLHLDASRPTITAQFLDFLRVEAAQAEALYILGDLFEAWVGDDEDSELATIVRGALRDLDRGGVPVFLMRGNRDFLIGQRFADATGATLLADPCVVLLYDQATLLMHGDLLCTDDIAYLGFREQVRKPEWQEQFLRQSLQKRHAFAGQARAASQQHQEGLRDAGALEVITDVNPTAVDNTMIRFGISRLIHGHTHRPWIHSLLSAGRSAQRIVLGDWYHQGSVLRVTREGFELSAL